MVGFEPRLHDLTTGAGDHSDKGKGPLELGTAVARDPGSWWQWKPGITGSRDHEGQKSLEPRITEARARRELRTTSARARARRSSGPQGLEPGTTGARNHGAKARIHKGKGPQGARACEQGPRGPV